MLSSCITIGIDPDFDLCAAPTTQARLFEMTSDDFFATHDPLQILVPPTAFAFDEMRPAEYALRSLVDLRKALHRRGFCLVSGHHRRRVAPFSPLSSARMGWHWRDLLVAPIQTQRVNQ